MIDVQHDRVAQQFYVALDGQKAVLQYRTAPGRMIFVHTEVPEAYQHHGIADQLAHAGLEYARAHDLKVECYCPYVAAYLHRHPEYQSLQLKKP